MQRQKLFAILELILAAGFWGFGFIAALWALEVMNFFEVTWLRFLLAAVAGLPIFLWRCRNMDVRWTFQQSLIPAVLLLATLILQTWGLHYTTATKSGFITTLYVVFVPILDSTIRRTQLSRRLWFCVVLAFIGTAFIVNLGFDDFNFGDFLTLLCAIAAALQIYWLGVLSPSVREPLAFNISQCFWNLLLLTPILAMQGPSLVLQDPSTWGVKPWIGILSLGLGSTLLAFYLQVRAQAKISLTLSSLLFLLESPFALFFAVLLLGESLTTLEAFGAVLIMIAAILASLGEAQSRRKTDRRSEA